MENKISDKLVEYIIIPIGILACFFGMLVVYKIMVEINDAFLMIPFIFMAILTICLIYIYLEWMLEKKSTNKHDKMYQRRENEKIKRIKRT